MSALFSGCNSHCPGSLIGYIIGFAILVAILGFFLGTFGVVIAVALFIGFMGDEGCKHGTPCGCNAAAAAIAPPPDSIRLKENLRVRRDGLVHLTRCE